MRTSRSDSGTRDRPTDRLEQGPSAPHPTPGGVPPADRSSRRARGRSYRVAAGRAGRRAAVRGDGGDPGARGPARRGRRADPGARGRGRWRGLVGLGGVHSVLSSAVKEVTSPVPWPRALLELGEGRRGPGEGTARVTGRAGRRSELEAGVGGDPCSGSGASTLFPGPSLRPCSPLSPACWPLLLGARLGPCALAVQRAGQSRVPLRPQHRAARRSELVVLVALRWWLSFCCEAGPVPGTTCEF